MGGIPNKVLPLVITARIINHKASKILIDGGSYCDIMYIGLLEELEFEIRRLSCYTYMLLQAFNKFFTSPWGRIWLIDSLGEGRDMRMVEVHFVVVL